jgi:hypothetical protein
MFLITSFISKKLKEQGFLRKSSPKTYRYPLDQGSGILKKFIPDPDPGSRGLKKTGSRIRIRNTGTGYTAHRSSSLI